MSDRQQHYCSRHSRTQNPIKVREKKCRTHNTKQIYFDRNTTQTVHGRRTVNKNMCFFFTKPEYVLVPINLSRHSALDIHANETDCIDSFCVCLFVFEFLALFLLLIVSNDFVPSSTYILLKRKRKGKGQKKNKEETTHVVVVVVEISLPPYGIDETNKKT